jgi:Protein of unknown function (DUF2796)
MSNQKNILASFCKAAMIAAVLPSLAFADGSALPEYVNGKLLVDVDGNAINARLRLPMAVANPDKPGLPPEEVLKRLKEGEKLFTFPGKGDCKLANGSAFAVDREGKPVKRAGDFGNIQASYRYECSAKPEAISVKVFEQLPDIKNLSLQLTSEKGEQSAEMKPGAPDLKL